MLASRFVSWSLDGRPSVVGARLAALGALCLSLLSTQCRKEAAADEERGRVVQLDAAALKPVLVNYANIAHATYADAAAQVRALAVEQERFLAHPSPAGLDAARRAWLAARRSYQQSEVFRFYDGPIDDVEFFINTWPIDENYVEAGLGQEKLGIVQDAKRYPEITAALLGALNAQEGETSISTGYHVIEFLLWGRDTRADGPGERPHSDYVVTAASDALPARRARYLRAATELLILHLDAVSAAWAAPGDGNYRAQFLALPARQALGLVIKGMGSLSGPELAGERLTVAYATKAQENEHSCFSDNTRDDLADDALGIQNICLGHYAPTAGPLLNGPGLCDFLDQQTPALAKRLRDATLAAVSAMRAIPTPFDAAILGNDAAPGRVAVRRAIDALERQTNLLSEIAAAYDARLTATKPNPSAVP